MKALLVVAALLMAAPEPIQDDDTIECRTPEWAISTWAIEPPATPLKFRLEGDELRAFNKNYEAQFHRVAPDNDLLLVFERSDDLLFVVSFRDGCAMAAPATMYARVFYALRDGVPL